MDTSKIDTSENFNFRIIFYNTRWIKTKKDIILKLIFFDFYLIFSKFLIQFVRLMCNIEAKIKKKKMNNTMSRRKIKNNFLAIN